MTTSFQITGLPHDLFAPWFELSDQALTARGAVRYVADVNPGYYCRVSLEDAQIGEDVLLLPFEHHRAESPYRSAGPIFVRRDATQQRLALGTLPLYVTQRLNSVRAYDAAGMMIEADVHKGMELHPAIERLFVDDKVAYLQLHDAKRGCFSCQVDRC